MHSPSSSRPALRFACGERVSCAVDDDPGELATWMAGTVRALWVQFRCAEFESERRAVGGAEPVLVAPYEIELDGGGVVLAHRDEHYMVRDPPRDPRDGGVLVDTWTTMS